MAGVRLDPQSLHADYLLRLGSRRFGQEMGHAVVVDGEATLRRYGRGNGYAARKQGGEENSVFRMGVGFHCDGGCVDAVLTQLHLFGRKCAWERVAFELSAKV